MAFLAFGSLTAILFVLMIPQGGEAVKCYVCNSMNVSQSQCADEFRKTTTNDKNFIQDCGPDSFCRKQYQDIRGEVRVSRSCGTQWDDTKEDGSCLATNSEDIHLLSCQCRGDTCNGAGLPLISLVTMLFPALLLLFKNNS